MTGAMAPRAYAQTAEGPLLQARYRWGGATRAHAQTAAPGTRYRGLPLARTRKRQKSAVLGVALGALCGLTLGACGTPEPLPAAPGLRVGDVLGSGPEEAAFARADTPRPFRFPADHGAHPDFRSEWWYLTVVLEDGAGREFGVQFTVFRQALFPGGPAEDPWRNGQAYLGHLAVTDVQAARHREAERLSRGHPALAGARAGNEGDFSVWLEGWQLSGTGDDWNLEAAAGDFAVSLRLAPTRPPVLQGDGGLSAKGPGQASHYYSVPRLGATGQLRIDANTYAVGGLGWLDREWSTSVLGTHHLGWDWFALMLDNGEDIMAFRLRRDDGARDPYDHGVLVDPAGGSRHLGSGDFRLEPLEYWQDERGTQWPVHWELAVGARRWRIAAPVHDQRMDTLLTYWEGLVHVLDERGRRSGRGYMELTGYQ